MGGGISRRHNLSLRLRRAPAIVLFLTTTLVAVACAVPRAQEPLAYQAPEQLEDGWQVSSLASEGIDAGTISQLVERIEAGRYNRVHSVLIVKNGKLVYEEYFGGFRREQLHRLYSVTKSVTSALVGIAIDKGFLSSVQEPVISFFPEYVDQNWDHDKDAITLSHLLSMSSGLRYDENTYPYRDERNSHTQMTASKDWMEWTLDQPLVAEPGTRFAYSTGNTHLFSGIIQKSTSMYANQFAEEFLFGPLGISDYFWTIGDGFPATGGSFGGLKLRPRDMAKFGYMYLNGGRWNGQQVVPEWWVSESFVPRVSAWWDAQYGYYWWLHRDTVSGETVDWIAARGYGDQLICLFPSLDMVVVMTCGNEALASRVEEAILTIAGAALRGQSSSVNDATTAQGTDAGWIVLAPIERVELGFKAAVPSGWTETVPGEFARGSSRADLTGLILRAYPGMTRDEVLELGAAELGVEGLAPQAIGTYKGASLYWDLYTLELDRPGVGSVVIRAALASEPSQALRQTDVTTYLVFLHALAEDDAAEARQLETIFLHAAYALTPLK